MLLLLVTLFLSSAHAMEEPAVYMESLAPGEHIVGTAPLTESSASATLYWTTTGRLDLVLYADNGLRELQVQHDHGLAIFRAHRDAAFILPLLSGVPHVDGVYRVIHYISKDFSGRLVINRSGLVSVIRVQEGSSARGLITRLAVDPLTLPDGSHVFWRGDLRLSTWDGERVDIDDVLSVYRASLCESTLWSRNFPPR